MKYIYFAFQGALFMTLERVKRNFESICFRLPRVHELLLHYEALTVPYTAIKA